MKASHKGIYAVLLSLLKVFVPLKCGDFRVLNSFIIQIVWHGLALF